MAVRCMDFHQAQYYLTPLHFIIQYKIHNSGSQPFLTCVPLGSLFP